MASVNMSETDFMVLASAANRAQQAGEHEDAEALDRMARKLNAALSGASVTNPFGRMTKNPKWQDMPSTLDPV